MGFSGWWDMQKGERILMHAAVYSSRRFVTQLRDTSKKTHVSPVAQPFGLVLTASLLLGVVQREAVGAFALSGGLTNWLAVHMLFEKVPLLYGSGVIPNRFEDFKAGIKTLIISEFFTREHIERFFAANGDADGLIEKVDFNRVFTGLLASRNSYYFH